MCIKVQYGCIFYPPKHNGTLCNSLKNFKTLKGPYCGPRSWSRHQIEYVTYSYADACINIFNTVKTSGHSSLEKYTSHFIERVRKGYERYYCVRGELDTEQNCNILTPEIYLVTSAFLSRSPGLLNQGPGGPASAGI